MLVTLLERGIVLKLDPLAGRADMGASSGLCAPETYVAVVATGENVAGIGCECDGEDALHALGMVDISMAKLKNAAVRI